MEVCNGFGFAAAMKGVVATIGMFDGVHLGHRHLLQTLLDVSFRRQLQPVVYTFDRHPLQVLHGDMAVQLLTTQEERLQRLCSVGDYKLEVLHFDKEMASLSACQFYERVLCRDYVLQTLVMGYDNSFGCKQNNDLDLLNDVLRRDGVVRVNDVPLCCNGVKVSSTQIRQALLSGDVALANAMLGYCYSLSGVVTEGRHIGNGMGFPTANLDCGRMGKLLPADGVYAVYARRGNNSWRAVANLGAQPTVGGRDRVLEVHILDDKPQLYGQQLEVDFVARLRDIYVFDNREALATQIQQDIEQCKRFF